MIDAKRNRTLSRQPRQAWLRPATAYDPASER